MEVKKTENRIINILTYRVYKFVMLINVLISIDRIMLI